jgi:hypothetical protein
MQALDPGFRMVLSRAVSLAVWLAFLVVASAGAQEAEPFRTRNLSPLVAIFGLPAWRLPSAGLEVGLTSELANHYRLSQRGPDTLILDGETWRNTLSIAKSIGERWIVAAELVHVRQSGGILDDVVDAWHSGFRLPDGGRNNRPEDDLEFRMADGLGWFYSLTRPESGFGDLSLSAARRFGADDRTLVTGTLKLATGDEDILAGSGGSDWALSVLRSRPVQWRNRPAGYFWGAGVFGLGEAEHIDFEQTGSGYMVMVGGGLGLGQRWGLKAQLDVQSALFESQLEEIGERAIQATAGGWWAFGERGLFEFAVNEDLEVSTSPDVVIHMNVRWSLQ